MAKHGQQPITLEQAVRAAGKAHRAEQYPGDLAEELGLGGVDTATRSWLHRWRPALALCAVLALAAGGIGLWAVLSASPSVPTQPAAEVTPEALDMLVPAPTVAQHNEPGSTASQPAEVTITRADFAAVKQQVADMRASAKRIARNRLGQMFAENRAMKMSVSLQPITSSALRLTAVPHIDFSLPGGLSMPAYSPSFTKELS